MSVATRSLDMLWEIMQDKHVGTVADDVAIYARVKFEEVGLGLHVPCNLIEMVMGASSLINALRYRPLLCLPQIIVMFALRELRYPWLQRLIFAVRQNEAVVPAFKLIAKIIESYPVYIEICDCW